MRNPPSLKKFMNFMNHLWRVINTANIWQHFLCILFLCIKIIFSSSQSNMPRYKGLLYRIETELSFHQNETVINNSDNINPRKIPFSSKKYNLHYDHKQIHLKRVFHTCHSSVALDRELSWFIYTGYRHNLSLKTNNQK